MTNTPAMDDIVFITLPDSIQREQDGFTFLLDVPLPVQLSDEGKSIDSGKGIQIEMIAAGL